MESKDLFEVLCEYASNTHFDEIICKDKEYSELLDEIIELQNTYQALELPEQQRYVVDDYVKANLELNGIYCHALYKQALKDCVVMLKELNIL